MDEQLAERMGTKVNSISKAVAFKKVMEGGNNMKKLLWLVWQNSESRRKYHVGDLLYVQNEGYYFEYSKTNRRHGLSDAIEAGFTGFFAFPDFEKKYFSPFLFHAFSRRIPNKGRPDYQKLLQFYGLDENTDEMDILEATKGKMVTDSYELMAPILVDSKKELFQLTTFIEGWQYYEGESVLSTLQEGTSLSFITEPDNIHDPYAVRIESSNGAKLGYVAAVYSEFFTHLLETNTSFSPLIKQVNKDSISQMKVLISISGKLSKVPSHYTHMFPLQDQMIYA